MGISVGGWVLSLEFRERPSPEAAYGSVRVVTAQPKNVSRMTCPFGEVTVVPLWS